MLNSNKIENLINEIKYIIKSNEIFDENYIFNYAKNYAKENNIEISKGEIKCIINNTIIELKNSNIINAINDEIYYKNEITFKNSSNDELNTYLDTNSLI